MHLEKLLCKSAFGAVVKDEALHLLQRFQTAMPGCAQHRCHPYCILLLVCLYDGPHCPLQPHMHAPCDCAM